jgi:hypothetical protein
MNVIITNIRDLFCSFFSGWQIAQYRSVAKAVSVKTLTPIDKSLKNSLIRHRTSPDGHESYKYGIADNGTQITITSKSPRANENIYLKKKETKLAFAIRLDYY